LVFFSKPPPPCSGGGKSPRTLPPPFSFSPFFGLFSPLREKTAFPPQFVLLYHTLPLFSGHLNVFPFCLFALIGLRSPPDPPPLGSFSTEYWRFPLDWFDSYLTPIFPIFHGSTPWAHGLLGGPFPFFAGFFSVFFAGQVPFDRHYSCLKTGSLPVSFRVLFGDQDSRLIPQ